MQIDYVKPSTASADVGEKFFSISDEAFIFEILRNKMYSNPILAVVREYSCNALDSMTECGRGDTPVEITLPTYSDLYFKVKDSGVGISPDRIENIYIKYAESTKRNDNSQIGGFGLGSKAGFAYSDSFTIITNFEGVKYNYACFIDETKLGKMALLSKESTSEPNGTTIIVPVKSYADISYFVGAVEQVCRHWKVKPIVHNGTVNYKTYNFKAEGSTWALAEDRNSYYDKECKVILGNIEYGLRRSELVNIPNITSILSKYKSTLVLKMNVGDLTLAANRESIQLDDKSKLALEKAVQAAEQEIDQFFQSKIDNIDNFYDAIVCFKTDISYVYDTVPKGLLKWNNKDIASFHIGFPHYFFYRNPSNNKITRQQNHSVRFESDFSKVRFYANDTNVTDLTARHVAKLFLDDANNIFIFKLANGTNLESFIKEQNLEDFGVEALSTVLNNIKNYNFGGSKFIVSKMESNGKFYMSSIDEVKKDSKKILLCHLTKNIYNEKVPYFENANLSKKSVKRILDSNSSISIYGVDKSSDIKKIQKVFTNFTWLEDYLTEQVTITKEEYFQSKFNVSFLSDSRSYIRNKINYFSENIAHKDSIFGKYVAAVLAVTNSAKEDVSKISLYEDINGYIREDDFEEWMKVNQKVSAKEQSENLTSYYPMLKLLGDGSYNQYYCVDSERIITNYINLMDSQ